MRLFTSIDGFRNAEDIESGDGEVLHHAYDVEDVLKFIKFEGKKLASVSDKGKTNALELLNAIHPEMRIDEEILEKLFELCGEDLFKEIEGYTSMMNYRKTKFKVYNGAIKGAGRRIDDLEEKICEEKINGSDSAIIEELESQLRKEEIWKDDLKAQRREMVIEMTEKPVYNLKGFDVKTGIHKDTGTKYNPKGFDINDIYQYTGTKYNLKGFDVDNIHKDTGTKYNSKGFDVEDIHKDTGTKFDPEGYKASGYNNEGYDREGYNELGYNKEGYDREGYNTYGYNKNGYNRKGIYLEIWDIVKQEKQKELEKLMERTKNLDGIISELAELNREENNKS